jgi:hypothetical protein
MRWIRIVLATSARGHGVKCGRADCDRVIVQKFGTKPRGPKTSHCPGHAQTNTERARAKHARDKMS